MNGNNVKIKCIKQGITQKQLAELYGMSYRQMNNVINGQQRNEQIEAILDDYVSGRQPVRYRKKFHRARVAVK